MKLNKCLAVSLIAALLVSNAAVVASAAEEPTTASGDTYVLMNIPYSDFYKSEVNNDIAVDIYTSATKSKTLGTRVKGSYHVNEDGSDITGVTYPVKVSEGVDLSKFKKVKDTDKYEVVTSGRGTTTTTVYEGKDSLFLGDSYSYYVLNEVPAYYKTLTVDENGNLQFSKDETTVTDLGEVNAEVKTNTSYGDYELDITSEEIKSAEKVYGVVFETKEGASYGFRHMENIWKNYKIAWATGFTTAVHGSPTSSDHYKAIMGQTINKAVFFTSDGIKTVELNAYVPVKTGASAKVENASVADGKTTFTTTQFADDFDYEYTVTDSTDKTVEVKVEDGTITYPAETKNGEYTFTITDKSGKYASVSTAFELTTAATAKFNGKLFDKAPALAAADGASADDFAAYLEAINKVTVNGKAYAASGRGAVALINDETGVLDTTNTDVFAQDVNEYSIVVSATGYEDLAFTVSRDTYVLMNIPYSDFYKSEVNNDIAVDIYTSATKSKTLGTRVKGSYHVNEDGSDITGVTYPVKVSEGVDLSKFKKVKDTDKYEVVTSGRGTTTTTVYEGKDSLFLGDSYSYYVLNEVPAYYKTLTVDENGNLQFSKDETTVTDLGEVNAEVKTNTSYGDYELDITSEEIKSAEKVYGVVFETKEGASYGFRHMENIWKNYKIAWATGFTTAVHGSPTSSDHYKAIMGQTINKAVFFTSDGIKTVELNAYVPVKTGASAKVENASVADGKTTFTTENFAEDFDYSYTVTDSADKAVEVTVENGTITYPADTKNGAYTLTISDKNGKYAYISTSFELTVPATAKYNEKSFLLSPALTAADGVSADDFAAYLEAINKVTVNDKAYSASGKGAVALIDDETGAIDTTNTDVFAKDVNEYSIVVSAAGYEDLAFTVKREAVSIENADVKLSLEEFSYDGLAKTPDVTVINEAGNVVDPANYDLEYKNNINAGSATVTVKAKGEYTGTFVKEYIINPRNISTFEASLSKTAYTYNGSAKKPAATVKLGQKTLKSGTDFAVTYKNNTKAGTATATITGKGNYTGTITKTFKISAKKVSSLTASLKTTSYTYTGSDHKPAVTVKDGSKTLVSGTDYTVKYTNSKNAGKATVTITGKGNYTGTTKKTYTIAVRKISTTKLSGVSASYKYTGKALTPAVTVKYGTKKLVKGTDYTVSYKSNKAIGTATITIKGKGNYTGTITKTFKIVPKTVSIKSATSPKTKQLKATWSKDTTVTGYQIVYSTNKNFNSVKTSTVTNKSTTSKTISNLTKGKTYYVKVRAYKTVNGKKVYGAYSSVKNVKIK